MASERCFCPCHTHPGVYPPPCNVCGHDNREGRMIGGYRDGWEPVDQRDARISTLTAELAAVTAERDALRARAERLGAFGLRLAERNTLTELVGHGSNQLWMCRVCDQVGEKASVPHAPDCPFAALAEQGEAG